MITFYSFCWSVIISSICIIILILFRRNSRFLLNLNITGTFTPPVRNEETIVPD